MSTTPRTDAAAAEAKPYYQALYPSSRRGKNEPVHAAFARQLEAGVGRLRTALEKLVAAEWMVTCDWASPDDREPILEAARVALAATPVLPVLPPPIPEDLQAAINNLVREHVGDYVYDIREREGEGWDGPRVKAWGGMSQVFEKYAKP